MSSAGQRGFGIGTLLVSLALGLLLAASASATQYQRSVEGVFGSAEQPNLVYPNSIVVDPMTDDLLISGYLKPTDLAAGVVIKRFNSDGTPAIFAALGTNAIDGKAGPGEKPCSEEPASCDKTPQNGLNEGRQIAVDPTNGNIYVTQSKSHLVDIFSSEGRYLGQLTAAGTKKFDAPCGVVVDSAGAVYVAQNLEINKYVASGPIPVNADNSANFKTEHEAACEMALGAGPSAGSIFITASGANPGPATLKVDKETGEFTKFVEGISGPVTVDPTSGNPIIGSGPKVMVEFDGAGDTAGAVLSRTVLDEPGEQRRIADAAFDNYGNLYVTQTYPGIPDTPIFIYGDPAVVPTVTANPATDVTGSQARLSGSVNPDGIEVTECFFEYGPDDLTVPCEESIPTDSEAHTVHATVSGLSPNGQKYAFRLAARNENGMERSADEVLETAQTTVTTAASVTGISTATLNGMLRPEGEQYTECFFEWGLTTNDEYEHVAPCSPSAGDIPPDFSPHGVSAPLGELQESTRYRYRLVSTNSEESRTGEERIFETFGVPQIVEVRAGGAGQNSATLEARINPNGFATSYRFEWGATAGYGNVTPARFEPVGSGQQPVRVSATISGLSTASTWHYRVIAWALAEPPSARTGRSRR